MRATRIKKHGFLMVMVYSELFLEVQILNAVVKWSKMKQLSHAMHETFLGSIPRTLWSAEASDPRSPRWGLLGSYAEINIFCLSHQMYNIVQILSKYIQWLIFYDVSKLHEFEGFSDQTQYFWSKTPPQSNSKFNVIKTGFTRINSV